MSHLPTVYHCLRLPASGDPVERLPYTTVRTATFTREGDDDVLDVVPDLRPHWIGNYEDRMIQRVILPSYLGGELLLYYATAGTRPANKTLLNVPAVREAVNDAFHADELFGRIFYRGDAFVVRLGAVWEDAFETDYEDVGERMVAEVVEMVQDLAVRNWMRGFLEYQRKQSDRYDRVESGALLKILRLTDKWLPASERKWQSYSVNSRLGTLLEREEAMYGWGEGTQARAKLKREPEEETQGRARLKREPEEETQGRARLKREPEEETQGRARLKREPEEETQGRARLKREPEEETQGRARPKREPEEETQGRARLKREPEEDIQGKGNVKRERGDDCQVGRTDKREVGEDIQGKGKVKHEPEEERQGWRKIKQEREDDSSE